MATTVKPVQPKWFTDMKKDCTPVPAKPQSVEDRLSAIEDRLIEAGLLNKT